MTRRSASRYRRAAAAAFFGLVLLALAAAGPAEGQAIIKVSDTVTLRFGVYLQAQADWLQLTNATLTDTIGYQQNLFLRRARLLFGGRIASDVYFYMDTDNSRLGYNKTGNSALGSGFQLLDAFGEWRIADAFMLDGGLIPVPYSREALTSSSGEFFFDASAYDYLQQTSTQSTGGNRDTGFLARGYFADHRLEYRLGVFQGARQTAQSKNAFRVSGRLQWEFFDREDMYSPGWIGSTFYPGWYQDKKVLAVGAGFDTQKNFRYYSGDLFAAFPVSKSGSIQGKFQYQYVNGGTTFAALPLENTEQVDLGYYFNSLHIAPIVRWEQRIFNGQPSKSDMRYGGGLNWYPFKANAPLNIKVVYIRVDPKTGVSTNEFGIQLQFFYW
ncbi:MAG TPA: hypothetical protein VL084_14695 [Thermoanaerobaculia bacterium]|nr:hypothetical protein [Thermoanaerobaculia bacterium]